MGAEWQKVSASCPILASSSSGAWLKTSSFKWVDCAEHLSRRRIRVPTNHTWLPPTRHTSLARDMRRLGQGHAANGGSHDGTFPSWNSIAPKKPPSPSLVGIILSGTAISSSSRESISHTTSPRNDFAICESCLI
ncbi:hypothetical protein CALCODRAFT_504997 [Calocera cornea HHB12733]|uniref:Uncharacterized protein n=1 Tax=Calocera cornea HHB12733 TaxID=1353952 RepID=A0A165C2W7_9BASI|nr:hypothetical protein CALCODRAFT_504997 [Calocera cornea HHB12733]